MLSELGVILLLFEVGLHTTIPDMLRVGGSAFLVAVLGVVVPFFLGWGVGAYFLPQAESLVHVYLAWLELAACIILLRSGFVS